MDFWQALQQITDLEFDKVEIWLDENGSLKPSEVLNNPDDFIVRLRDRTRLTPIAFSLAQDVSKELFANLCRLCKNLRVTQIIVPSSELGTPFNSEIDRLKEMTNQAAIEGIRVGIKTERGRLSEDPHTAAELCEAVKGLGLAFDPSYFLGEKEEQTLEMVSPHTLHVHLRDSTQSQVQVQVGLGEVDYSNIITQLERQKFNRALSVEIIPALLESMDLEQRMLELRKLRMLLDSLM